MVHVLSTTISFHYHIIIPIYTWVIVHGKNIVILYFNLLPTLIIRQYGCYFMIITYMSTWWWCIIPSKFDGSLLKIQFYITIIFSFHFHTSPCQYHDKRLATASSYKLEKIQYHNNIINNILKNFIRTYYYIMLSVNLKKIFKYLHTVLTKTIESDS